MKWKDLLPASWKSGKTEEKENKYMTPADFFETLQRRVDEIFEEFQYPHILGSERTFYPKVDITETDKEIVIKADVPGIEEKDLDVSITKDSVIIQGEKKHEYEENKGNFYRKERSYGSFRRVIPLPVEVEESKVEATYKNGVLTITLPKLETHSKNIKKIPIKGS